jgi:hypothetical protein
MCTPVKKGEHHKTNGGNEKPKKNNKTKTQKQKKTKQN